MDARRALLSGLIDYAGLFPPALLSMEDAVAEYARRYSSDQSWILGAFVVPAGRLSELATAAAPHEGLWLLSVLIGPDPDADLERVVEFQAAFAHRFRVVSLEIRARDRDELSDWLQRVPWGVDVFCELDWREDPSPWLPVLRLQGAWAKLRTGGVTPDLIPPLANVAVFLTLCAETGVGLKFTAGLHHPVRAEHALTYEADAPVGTMHGFLNMFVAAALLAIGPVDSDLLLDLLDERDATVFVLDADGISWRDQRVDAATLEDVRRRFARGFGSCSFAEPVEDLQTLGML